MVHDLLCASNGTYDTLPPVIRPDLGPNLDSETVSHPNNANHIP